VTAYPAAQPVPPAGGGRSAGGKDFRVAFKSPSHAASADQLHAAVRAGATLLSGHARDSVLLGGYDPGSVDVVTEFARSAVVSVLVDDMAPCGCTDDVLRAALMLVSELTLRLAGAQVKLAKTCTHDWHRQEAEPTVSCPECGSPPFRFDAGQAPAGTIVTVGELTVRRPGVVTDFPWVSRQGAGFTHDDVQDMVNTGDGEITYCPDCSASYGCAEHHGPAAA
jgi:hypothetical protein